VPGRSVILAHRLRPAPPHVPSAMAAPPKPARASTHLSHDAH
jgi:hypothetical protein